MRYLERANAMAIWDDVLTERDKLVFSEGGFGKRIGFGEKPALVIIDVNYNFVGDKPGPVLESIKRFPLFRFTGSSETP